MSSARLERLLSPNEGCVIIAMDHCEFAGPIQGLIDPAEPARKIDGCVDAILLSPAMIPLCREAFNYKGAPMAVGRLNWSTVFCFKWKYRDACAVPAFSPAEALRLGADAALVSLTLETGSEERDARNVGVFRKLCREAKDLGMPVIGEYFPADPDSLSPEEMHRKVYTCVRIIAELGADLIKTFYTKDFSEVTRSCPVPVLGLGAEKLPTQLDALRLAADEVAHGAGGVVFGRNAFQVPDPGAFQRALCDVVKRDVPPEEAAKNHKLRD